MKKTDKKNKTIVTPTEKLSGLEQYFLLFLSNYSAEVPASKLDILSYFPINGRTLRNICLNLRSNGYKICFSFNGGYYIAENEEEYTAFRDRYVSYSNKITRAVQAMDKSTLYKNDIKRILTQGGS